MNIRAAVYVRVSSEEQTQGFSLDAQEKAACDYARSRGWEVAKVYVDAGFSARTDNRPRFRQMVADAQDKLFQAIIVHKFDRFARNRKDAVTYKALLKKCGVNVLSVSEPIDPDDPSGVITEGMLEVMAEWYSANLSRETMKGKRARAQAGLQNNATPFGYVKGPGKDAVAQIDPESIQGYHLAVKLALEGKPDREIAWALNQAGYRTRLNRLFSKDSVADILEKRYYLGEIIYRNEWYPGRHPAAIDRETFDRVQAMRRMRAPRANKAHVGTRAYPLTTVLYCAECGGKMRGNASLKKIRSYRCTAREHGLVCTQHSARAVPLEETVGEFIAALRLPDNWRAKALTMMGEDGQEIERIQSQRSRLEGELKRARSLFVAGDMLEAEYNQHRERITLSLSNLQVPSTPDLDRAAEILSNFGLAWKLASDQERKRLVMTLLARVWVKEKKIVGIEPRPGPYVLLAGSESELPVGSASDIRRRS